MGATVKRPGAHRVALLALLPAALASAAGACAPAAPVPRAARPPASSAPAAASASAPAVQVEAPPAIASPAITLPAINRTVLPNGLELWHAPLRTLPMVHVRLVLKAGAMLDRDRPGLARLTSQALVRQANAPAVGTTSARVLLPMPAAHTWEYGMVFALDVPRDQLDDATDAFGALARQPKLDTAPLPELRTQLLQAQAEALRGDPASIATAIATRELLGFSMLPTAGELARLTVADLKAFHKAAFAPGQAALIVVGDVTFDEAAQSARRALGSWDAPSGKPWVVPEAEPIQYTRVIVVDRPQSSDMTAVLAAPGPREGDPSSRGLMLARELAARPPGAAPSSCASPSSAAILGLQACGGPLFSVCLAAPRSESREHIAAALESFKLLAERAPSDADLELARAGVADRFAISLRSHAHFADLAAASFASGLAHDQTHKLLPQVLATTAARLHEAARARFRGGMLVVVVGDAYALAEALSRLGDVTVLDSADGYARKRTIPARPSDKP